MNSGTPEFTRLIINYMIGVVDHLVCRPLNIGNPHMELGDPRSASGDLVTLPLEVGHPRSDFRARFRIQRKFGRGATFVSFTMRIPYERFKIERGGHGFVTE